MEQRLVLPVVAAAAALLASSVGAAILGIGGDAASETTGASGHDHHHADGGADTASGHEHGADAAAAGHVHDFADLEAHKAILAPFLPRHENFRSGEAGRVPTAAEASSMREQLRSFRVVGDAGLAEMVGKGYVSGAGTRDDPYLIDGFRVREDLTIEDTSKAVVLRNSLVEGTLRLNYNGGDVYVHHNRIHDLRVNENVERAGDTTAGLFEHNAIDVIGQLRHFSGEFAHNSVGPRPSGVIGGILGDSGTRSLDDGEVWNFDGYHLAHVHNNTVLGRVDVKLHGHHHGDAPDGAPHDHADAEEFPPGNEREDGLAPATHHSIRFHTLDFEHNTIRVEAGRALRFYDEAHAGDDQTADSEPNEYLEDLHEHHTFIRIAGNRITGGPLVLDIVDARDGRHEGHVSEALVQLQHNTVTMERPRGGAVGIGGWVAAYIVREADTLTLHAADNGFEFTSARATGPSGYRWLLGKDYEASAFRFETSRATAADVVRTIGSGADYGVTLVANGEAFDVRLTDNRFNAKEDVHRA